MYYETISTMTISEIRRINLRHIIDTKFDGKEAAFADHAGKDKAQINRLFADTDKKYSREIGNSLARDLESAGGMPHGWLDIDHTKRAIDTDLLEQIIEIVRIQTKDLDDFSSKEFALTVANVYSDTVDEPEDLKKSTFISNMISKLTSIVLRGIAK